VDLRPATNLLVRVAAALDAGTGLLSWRFTSIDPATGDLPSDPLVGFLPPNLMPPEGQGSVMFTIMPRAGLPTGTEIRNQAAIVFDVNPPISTGTWLNTIDNAAPVSGMEPLAATQAGSPFPISWTGSDAGAGVGDYTVFVSDNGGPFTPFLTKTSDTSAVFPGEDGHTYAFYTIAHDLAGNGEPPKGVAEATTHVVLTQPNLQVSTLKGKAVAGAGLNYKATDTTRSAGTVPVAASATKFYLSDNGTWDAGDTLLEPAAGRAVSALAAGASHTAITTLTIPAGTPPGKYSLIARADAGGQIAESDEADNTRARTIYVGPDLRVLKLTGPASAAAGQSISVTDTTKNSGGAPTSLVTITSFYLSRNKKLDATDVPLAPGRSVPVLAAGAVSALATIITIASGTAPGGYYILARTDDGEAESESRETNNVKARAITIE
jgi:hypothetical protein